MTMTFRPRQVHPIGQRLGGREAPRWLAALAIVLGIS